MRSCQVFISHSSWDEAAASAACRILERRGISCWVAARDFGPNHDFTSAVVAAIDRCDVLLLVLSSRANSSHHIMKEVQRAAAQHKLVAVLRIEDIQPTKLEFFFSGVCWLDAVNSSIEAALAGFVEETGLLVDRNESCGGAERVNRSVASGTLRGSLPSRSEGQRAASEFDVFISLLDAMATEESFDDTERTVREILRRLGYQAISSYVALQRDGDIGESVETEDGKVLYRSETVSRTRIRSIFGVHQFEQFTYSAGKHKAITLRLVVFPPELSTVFGAQADEHSMTGERVESVAVERGD